AQPPALYQQLIAPPWHQVPVADRTRDRGHGRVETRRLQVTTVAGLDFPRAAQALRITRRARPLAGRRWRTVTVCHHQPHRRPGPPRGPAPPPAAPLPSPARPPPRLLAPTPTLPVEHVLAAHRAARHNRPEHGRGTDLP